MKLRRASKVAADLRAAIIAKAAKRSHRSGRPLPYLATTESSLESEYLRPLFATPDHRQVGVFDKLRGMDPVAIQLSMFTRLRDQ